MRHRLPLIKALLTMSVGFFLFNQGLFAQASCGDCDNSVQLVFPMGTTIFVDQTTCLGTAALDPDGPTNAGGSGEHFPDLNIVTSPLDPAACSAAGVTITNVVITDIELNNVTIPISFTVGNLNPGDILQIQFDAELSNGLCSDQIYSLRVEDNVPPVINCPPAEFVDCINDIAGVPFPNVTYSDACLTNGADVQANYQGQTPAPGQPGYPTQCAGGSVTRTWTAPDGNGGTLTCTQNIVVGADTQAPTISQPNNVQRDLGTFCSIAQVNPTYGGVLGIETVEGVDIQDCTPDAVMGFSMVDNLTGGTACPQTYSRVYTITDACGNALTLTQTFSIGDVDPPVITAQPQNVTDACNSTTGTQSALMNWIANAGGATAQDNCGGGLTVTVNPNPGTLPACPNGDYTFTFTFTDACNNSVSTNPATYTINDSTAPTVSGGAPAVVDCNGGDYLNDLGAWLSNAGGTMGSDACSGPPTLSFMVNGMTMTAAEIQALLIADVNDANCDDNVVAIGHPGGNVDDVLGFVEVTFVYTDLCNNLPSSSTALRFVVTDSGVPTISTQAGPGGIDCSVGSSDTAISAWLTSAGGATASDDCGGAITWSAVPQNGPQAGNQIMTNGVITYGGAISDIIMNPTPGCGTGMVTVDFRATDACGNTSAAVTTATFTVTDNQGPTISSFPETYQVDCNNANPGAELAAWLASGGNNPNTPQPGAMVSDDCSTFNTYYFLQGTYNPFTDTDGNPGNNPGVNSVSIADLTDGCGQTGNLGVEWFFFDACGNYTTSGPINFSVIDNTPPTLNNPATDLMMECDGGGNMGGITNWLNSNGGATASDLCGAVTWTNNYTSLVGGCAMTGSATVGFTASDECGNTVQTFATITVTDTVDPFFTTPASSMQVNCDSNTDPAGALGAWLANNIDANAANGGAIATDNCSGSGSVITSLFYFTSGTYDPNTDPDNNPFNNTGINDVSIGTILAGCVNGQAINVDFFAIDQCGNIGGPTTGSFSLTDTEPPVISQQPADLTISCEADQAAINAAYNAWVANNGGALATDGCSGITWTANEGPITPGICGGKIERNVSWTATDACGNNVTTNTVMFSTIDFTPPTLPGATSLTEECGPGGAFGTAGTQAIGSDQAGLQDWINQNGYQDPNLITDNCSEPVVMSFSWTDSNGATGGTGQPAFYPTINTANCNWAVTVTFTGTDGCGNVANSQASFTIFDNVPPGFASGNLPMINVAAGPAPDCAFNTNGIATPAVMDNCTGSGSLMVTFVDSAPVNVPCDPVTHVFQQVTRTWTVTDGCGLSNSLNQTIGVTDWNPPAVQYPPNVVVDCAIDFSEPAFTGGGVTAISDGLPINNGTRNADCNDVSVTWSDSALNCVNGSGTITRTWFVSDACGNSNPPYNQIITVQDNTPPTIDIVADDVEWSCGGDGTFCGFTDDPNVAFNCWIETVAYYAAGSDNCSGIVNLPVGQVGIYNPGSGSGAVIFYTDGLGNVLPTSWCAWMAPDQPDGNGNLVPTYAPFTVPAGLTINTFCPSNSASRVDFVVKDDCGNTNVSTATWSITDPTPPQITDCPKDVTINTSDDGTGDCSSTLTFNAPIVIDDCGVDSSPCFDFGFTYSTPSAGAGNMAPATFTGAPSPNDIIEPMTISFNVQGPPTAATGPVVLDLDFFGLDGEYINTGHTEFFFIVGEDGSMLGQTGPTATQCGNLLDQQVTIPAAIFNQWALDGIVQFTLQPNNPGAGLENLAINNTCGGTTVIPDLIYNCTTPPAGNTLTYTVDYDCDGTPDFGPSPVSYPTMTHTFFGPSSGSGSVMTGSGSLSGTSCVTFTATDCTGNSSVCSFNVTVQDDEPPTIVGCPTLPTTLNTPDCEAVCITLPRPSDVADNCEVMNFNQMVPFNSMTFTAHPNITGFILDTTTVNFNLAGSPPPSSDAIVTIEFKGDIDGVVPGVTPQEMLDVYMGSTLIGSTGSGPHCSPNFTTIGTFTVPLATLLSQYNSTGNVDIMVAPVFQTLLGFGNDGDANNDDFGINPCVAPGTFADDISITNVTDNGNTMMNVSIEFESSAFTYCIDTQFDQFDMTNVPFPADGSDPEICLPPGMNTVKIKAMDAAGNIDSTSCIQSILVTAPSLGNASISANMTNFNCPGELVILDENSGYVSGSGNAMWNWYLDNAPAGQGPEDLLVGTTATPQIAFPALSGSNNYYVVITDNLCVSDPSAAITISTNQVAVSPVIFANPNPICDGESFGLFIANPQMTWTDYTWTGPNGYFSTLQQPPAVTNASTIFSSGVYELCVTDINGCTVCGSVFVNVAPNPGVPSITSNSPVCDGDPIILSTSTECDTYVWIGPDGSSPGTLMNPLLTTTTNTTTIPSTDSAYDAGLWTLICQNANGCGGESDPIEVVISPPLAVAPTADPSPACAGDDVQLSVGAVNGATSYVWSGPNGFSASSQNPIIGNANADDAGTYSVVVTDANGCTGAGSVEVNVGDGVNITAISYTPGPGACVTPADDLQFMVSEFPVDPGCYTYEWSGPNGFSSITKDAIIPNVSSANSGNYILTIYDCDGCASAPFEVIVDLNDQPTSPLVNVDNSSVCEGDEFELCVTNATECINTVYTWNTPIGSMTTNVPCLTISDASLVYNGEYSVTYNCDGCESEASDPITISVTTQPETPVVSGPAVACEGSSLQLSTDFVMGAEYCWTGPNGFTAGVQNPVIFPVTASNAGAYQVVVKLNGCASDASDPFLVGVTESPDSPSITSNGPICLDDPSAELTLSIDGASTPGATYEWFDQFDNSIGASGIAPSLTITDFSAYGPGDFTFYVVCDINGCTTAPSVPVIVTFDQIPAGQVADAGPDLTVCDGDNTTLEAVLPTVGTGTWTQIGGAPVTILDDNDPNTVVSGMSSGSYTFRWSLSNGACLDYSSDDMIVVVNTTDAVIDAGGQYFVCEDVCTTLNALNPGTGNTGTWTQSTTQADLGVTITDPSDAGTEVCGLVVGNEYEFIWTVSNPGCGDVGSSTAIVTVQANNNQPFAGPNSTECGDMVMLNAVIPNDCDGLWTSADANVTFADATDPNTMVFGLSPGDNTLTWTISCGSCPSASADVVVNYEAAPTAANDVINIPYGEIGEISVTDNDGLPTGGWIIEVIDGPSNGTVVQTSPGVFEYTPDYTNYVPSDQFTYELCSASCPDICVTAIVAIGTDIGETCTPPTIFTPNMDNYNDAFVVPCLFELSKYPNNEVVIFNQWGDEVFRAQPYMNDWMGTYNGEDLPVGTYFYIIDLNDGSDPITGFLVLER